LEGDVEQLVLLGDALELRNQPAAAVLAAAEPVFRALGKALGSRPIVIVPGNHDHALVERWLARRGEPLGLEQRISPKRSSDLAAALRDFLGDAPLELAYPGIWLRDDVYATHGHYLDVHLSMPTFERVALAASARVALAGGKRWNDVHAPDDYEAVLAPLYAWMHAAAQGGKPGQAISGGGTLRAWRALRAGRAGGLGSSLLSAGFPAAVALLNAAGLGPLESDLSMAELRRAGLRGISEVVERLRIGAQHVVFGHTHRAGMLAADVPAEWLTPNNVQLHNPGSWVYSATFLAGGNSSSPYWPGRALLIGEDGPPELIALLADRDAASLRAPLSAAAPAPA
jgi:predicted phosphodiesterase